MRELGTHRVVLCFGVRSGSCHISSCLRVTEEED